MGAIQKGREAFERSRRYWLLQIWSEGGADASVLAQFRLLASRSIYIVVAGFGRDRIKLRAAALTYVTLLSLVPAVVVGFTLFTAFGGFDATEAKLKSLIINTLAVESQRETILGYLDQLLASGASAKLGTAGTALLLLTVISLLSNIELSFNDIWGLRKSRTLLQRFQVYWPLITLGPILLGVSMSLTSSFVANEWVRALYESVPGITWLARLASALMTCLFFTLLYQIMPNTRVQLRHAAVGGFVAGVMWLTAGRLYAVYAANAITYSTLYGSLGAIPLFVIWIYVSWIVTLLGAALTFAIQSAKTYEPERPIAFRDRELAAVRLVVGAAQRYAEGRGAIAAQALVDQVVVPPRVARQLLEILCRHGLLTETLTKDDDVGYVPGRPVEDIAVAEIVRALRADRDITPLEVPDTDPVGRAVAERLLEAETASAAILGATRIADLIALPGPARERSPVLSLATAGDEEG